MILLLQEFDLVVKDIKGSENVIADHLSKLDNKKVTSKELEIEGVFPNEKLFLITEKLWFANISNFKVVGMVPEGYNWHQKRKIFKDASQFI